MIRTETYRELFILKDLLDEIHIDDKEKRKAIYVSLGLINKEHGQLLGKLTDISQAMEANMDALVEIVRDNK